MKHSWHRLFGVKPNNPNVIVNKLKMAGNKPLSISQLDYASMKEVGTAIDAHYKRSEFREVPDHTCLRQFRCIPFSRKGSAINAVSGVAERMKGDAWHDVEKSIMNDEHVHSRRVKGSSGFFKVYEDVVRITKNKEAGSLQLG